LFSFATFGGDQCEKEHQMKLTRDAEQTQFTLQKSFT